MVACAADAQPRIAINRTTSTCRAAMTSPTASHSRAYAAYSAHPRNATARTNRERTALCEARTLCFATLRCVHSSQNPKHAFTEASSRADSTRAATNARAVRRRLASPNHARITRTVCLATWTKPCASARCEDTRASSNQRFHASTAFLVKVRARAPSARNANSRRLCARHTASLHAGRTSGTRPPHARRNACFRAICVLRRACFATRAFSSHRNKHVTAKSRRCRASSRLTSSASRAFTRRASRASARVRAHDRSARANSVWRLNGAQTGRSARASRANHRQCLTTICASRLRCARRAARCAASGDIGEDGKDDAGWEDADARPGLDADARTSVARRRRCESPGLEIGPKSSSSIDAFIVVRALRADSRSAARCIAALPGKSWRSGLSFATPRSTRMGDEGALVWSSRSMETRKPCALRRGCPGGGANTLLLTPATLNPPTRHASSFSSASIAAPRGSAGDGAIDRRRSYAGERRRINGQILGCPKVFFSV